MMFEANRQCRLDGSFQEPLLEDAVLAEVVAA